MGTTLVLPSPLPSGRIQVGTLGLPGRDLPSRGGSLFMSYRLSTRLSVRREEYKVPRPHVGQRRDPTLHLACETGRLPPHQPP
jgi:hypothetical protein